MTGDGLDDLIVGSVGYPFADDPGILSILPATAAGPLGEPERYFLDGDGGRFAVADFDNDGDEDIAIFSYGEKLQIQTFLSETN